MVFDKAMNAFKFTIYIFFKSQQIPLKGQKKTFELLAGIFNL